MSTAAPDIFAYDDHRAFLRDWIVARKQKRGFSFRAFSKRAGFKAHNMLQMIARGERNLTLRSTAKFVKGLGLSRDEARYFEDLVRLGLSKTPAEKMEAFDRLASQPRRRRLHPLERSRLTFFRNWLAPVIFEMTRLPGFEADATWIAGRFDPPQSVTEVGQVLSELIAGGFLVRSPKGWRPSMTHLFSGDNVKDYFLFAYHEEALARGAAALENVPVDERQFHVVTTAVAKSRIPKMRELMERFERDLVRLADDADEPPDEVVQVNLQLFPVLRGGTGRKA